MAPAGAQKKKAISQAAFDALVQENIEEFDMEPADAAADAVQALSLQGADLSGIDTTAPSLRQAGVPVEAMVRAIEASTASKEAKGILEECRKLAEPLVAAATSDNWNSRGGAVSPQCLQAVRAGLTEAATAACRELVEHDVSTCQLFLPVVQLLRCALTVPEAQHTFWKAKASEPISAILADMARRASAPSEGPSGRAATPADNQAGHANAGSIAGASSDGGARNADGTNSAAETGAAAGALSANGAEALISRGGGEAGPLSNEEWEVVESCAAVLASSCRGFELNKEAFMDAGAPVTAVKLMRCGDPAAGGPALGALEQMCASLAALTTADDPRVLSSKAFTNARTLAKLGAVPALVSVLQQLTSSGTHTSGSSKDPSKAGVSPQWTEAMSSALIALKAVCANEEICRSAADQGAISLILQMLEGGGSLSKAVMSHACAALAQLAGSDANKDIAVERGALEALIALPARNMDDSAIVRESMAAIAALTLRSPANASRAAKSGGIEVAAAVLQSDQLAPSAIRQACCALRNLAVRNPELRDEMRNAGVQDALRAVKSTHSVCAEACEAALRDMGEDNYKN